MVEIGCRNKLNIVVTNTNYRSAIKLQKKSMKQFPQPLCGTKLGTSKQKHLDVLEGILKIRSSQTSPRFNDFTT